VPPVWAILHGEQIVQRRARRVKYQWL
jgi:hypothetical protein